MSQTNRKSTVDLTWPYRMQPHPDGDQYLSSQQILEKYLTPSAPYTRIGFGGPKGGGKSYGARAMAMLLAYKFPIVVVLVRSRLVTLKRNHILPAKNELRDWLEEGIIDYNEQDKIFYMPSGGMVMFMHCSRPADVDQFEGVAGDLYILEEAGHYSYDMMVGMMKNNRSSDIAINRGASYRPRTLFTFNWGGQGHSTLRRWFWDEIYWENENPKNYAYIFAPLDQNTALLTYNPEYMDNLRALPKQLREAYLIGDPDAFIGTMFTIIRSFHEIDPVGLLKPYNEGKPRSDWRAPEDWRLVGSLDAGIGAPCSFGLYLISPEGVLYKLFTYYDKKSSAPAHVKAIIDRIRACRWTGGKTPEFIVADNYAFQSSNPMGAPGGDITWEDLFAVDGMPLHRVKYNRITAIMGLQSALHYELDDDNEKLEVEPKLQLFEDQNEDLIAELQAARRSESGNPEDIDKDAADHAIDETKNMVLTAENPPAYVPLKKVKKPDPKKDYGSRIDRLKEIFGGSKGPESDFRRAL